MNYQFTWTNGACFIGTLCVGAITRHGDGLVLPILSGTQHLKPAATDTEARQAVERGATAMLNQIVAASAKPAPDPAITRMLDVTCPKCGHGHPLDIGDSEPTFTQAIQTLERVRASLSCLAADAGATIATFKG